MDGERASAPVNAWMTVKRGSDCQAPVVEGPDADTYNKTFWKHIMGHTEGTAESIRPSSLKTAACQGIIS